MSRRLVSSAPKVTSVAKPIAIQKVILTVPRPKHRRARARSPHTRAYRQRDSVSRYLEDGREAARQETQALAAVRRERFADAELGRQEHERRAAAIARARGAANAVDIPSARERVEKVSRAKRTTRGASGHRTRSITATTVARIERTTQDRRVVSTEVRAP